MEFLLFVLGILTGGGIAFAVTRRGSANPFEGRRVRDARPGPLPEENVLDLIAEGVVILDERLRLLFANSAAARVLGFQTKKLPARLPSEEVNAVARRAYREAAEVEDILTLWFPRRSTIKVRAVPLDGGVHFAVVLHDVTEESLAQRVRREFVSHASHELKSPVAGLQTLAEAVQTAVQTDDRDAAQRFAEKLRNESDRLGRLVGDLLDLSRLEDTGEATPEPVNLTKVARRELEQVRGQSTAKSMTLEDRIDADAWVLGDEEQMALLFRNLLENAVRYTPDGGTVGIAVAREGNHAVVTVSDTGIGIPTEAQGRIFERFYRVDRARSRARGGTGLGLAIVKHVAETHGGDVSVQSELGRGSSFVVRLPVTDPPAASVAG